MVFVTVQQVCAFTEQLQVFKKGIGWKIGH